VRWDLCQEELKALGVTGILELAPGGVLTGIAKRSLPDIERFAVKSAGDVEEARAFVAAHGTGN
jgi:[acyl-carrier-protein] S-malonyltransferase